MINTQDNGFMFSNKLYLIGLLLIVFFSCNESKIEQNFVSKDIENFWKTYDLITQTEDTLLQKEYLQEMFLDKGSPGLESIIKARNYTKAEYINAIKSYPKYWNSIRSQTLSYKENFSKIENNIHKLKEVYPNLSPATIYFTFGVFRTNGTTFGDKVLIGSEMAFADESAIIDELPQWRQPFYADYKPLSNLPLLCTHEYIHTQQSAIVEQLIPMCLYEGVAEFISCHATGSPSNSPAIEYGKKNEELIISKFIEDIFRPYNNYNWLWGENRNELKVRDLGYYIGYEISEKYYNKSTDKLLAIKEMIELDYSNEAEIERIVDDSNFFPKPMEELKKDYENKRPTVLRITEFENGSQSVSPKNNSITVYFSEELDEGYSGLDFGPLGKEYYPKVNNPSRKWGDKNDSYSFEVDLEADKKYQMAVSGFRSKEGMLLKPFVIDFHTSE